MVKSSSTITRLASILWILAGGSGAPASFAGVDDREAGSATENASRTHVDEELARRLYNEAPQAWARLRERMKTQRGSYRMSKSGAGVGWEPRFREVEFAINGENMKAAFQRDGVEVVVGTNEDYAFSISRRAGDANAVYAIQWLEQRGQDPEFEAEIEARANEYCQSANGSWNFLGRLFSEWFEEPGFTVHGVALEKASGEEHVRVDFSYLPPQSTETPIRFSSAYAVFDPADDWILRECNFYPGWGSIHNVYEYAQPVDGIPVLAERRMIVTGDDGTTMKVTELIDAFSVEPTPAEEFRLPFYGLPEPNFEESWYGSWLIYLIGGAACLTAAYAFRRRRQAAV